MNYWVLVCWVMLFYFFGLFVIMFILFFGYEVGGVRSWVGIVGFGG